MHLEDGGLYLSVRESWDTLLPLSAASEESGEKINNGEKHLVFVIIAGYFLSLPTPMLLFCLLHGKHFVMLLCVSVSYRTMNNLMKM